jgi:hypothetical protein
MSSQVNGNSGPARCCPLYTAYRRPIGHVAGTPATASSRSHVHGCACCQFVLLALGSASAGVRLYTPLSGPVVTQLVTRHRSHFERRNPVKAALTGAKPTAATLTCRSCALDVPSADGTVTLCLQSPRTLSVTVACLGLSLSPVRLGRPLSDLVVVRLSGQPDHAIGHVTISKPGLVGSTQGADRAPRVQSPRELPLTPTSSVDTSGAPAAPVDGTERASHSAPATRNPFDPATCCLQRRFDDVGQLPLPWRKPVSLSSATARCPWFPARSGTRLARPTAPYATLRGRQSGVKFALTVGLPSQYGNLCIMFPFVAPTSVVVHVLSSASSSGSMTA